MHSETAETLRAKFSSIFSFVYAEDLNGLVQFLSVFERNSIIGLLNQPFYNIYTKNEEFILHFAASKLYCDLLNSLLEHGADPNVLDNDGRTAAILVLQRFEECSCKSCARMTVQCINVLGDHNGNFGIPDKSGNMPLFIAAHCQSKEIASALLRNRAPLELDLNMQCLQHGVFPKRNPSMLTILSEKLPSMILEIFDQAVKIVGTRGIHDPDCEVAIDLSVILPSKVMESYQSLSNSFTTASDRRATSGTINLNKIHPSGENLVIQNSNNEHPTASQLSKTNSSIANDTQVYTTKNNYKPRKEMGYLNDLLEAQHSDRKTQKEILRHPLVTVFTDVKWRSLELIFLWYIVMQIGVLIAYTTFIFITIFVDCPYEVYQTVGYNLVNVGLSSTTNASKTSTQLCELQLANKVLSSYVLFCTLAVVVKELQHLILDFKEYCTDVLNYIQILGLSSVILTIVIAWDASSYFYTWLYPVASFGVAISWCQIFVQIGRFPRLALYVDMLAKVIIKFLVSLLIYSFILIGFAMSYCILFPVNPSLKDIPQAVVRILTMMVGELDYEGLFQGFKDNDNYHNDEVGDISNVSATRTSNSSNPKLHNHSLKHSIAAHFWYVCCVIVITLVLMNLLLGLAVSDIQGCRKHAEVNVMKRRIRYTTYLEKSFYIMTHFLPRFIKDYLRNKIAIIKPSNEPTLSCFQFHKIPVVNCQMLLRPNDQNTGILSEVSKCAIKYWIEHRPNKRTKQVCKFQKRHTQNDQTLTVTPDCSLDKGFPPTSARTEYLNIRRIERKLADVDHKLDLLIEAVLTRGLESQSD